MNYTNILLEMEIKETKTKETKALQILKDVFSKDKKFQKLKKQGSVPELLNYAYNTGQIEKISKKLNIKLDSLAELVKQI